MFFPSYPHSQLSTPTTKTNKNDTDCALSHFPTKRQAFI